MAVKDPQTATHVDPNSRISETSVRATFTGLTRNEVAYNYWDEGVGHFSDSFEHLLTIDVAVFASSGMVSYWTLGNTLNDADTFYANPALFLFVQPWGGDRWSFVLRERYNNAAYDSTYTPAPAPYTYYMIIERDENVGTYGTLYAYFFSDSARTNLVNTETLTLHAKIDFRYIYMVHSWNTGNTFTITGWAENLDLQEAGVTGNPYYYYRQQ